MLSRYSGLILNLPITGRGGAGCYFITYQLERKGVLKDKGRSKLNFPQYQLNFSNQRKFSGRVERGHKKLEAVLGALMKNTSQMTNKL